MFSITHKGILSKEPTKGIFGYIGNKAIEIQMPAATPANPTTASKVRMVGATNKSLYASTQSRFAINKVIQNLGSGNDGVQFFFASGLRTAHGRD
ncbi:hypothetical protein [Prochlorococcus sp. MIT 1341]|uniref:hypothetical protein n=1 Tax=Prochlorococcus sp. MIT 1341 TaxID=3096221 RepID=UPI002A750201|nr:hypothetical protein [Prochlorococcus sp. MIT 1341]